MRIFFQIFPFLNMCACFEENMQCAKSLTRINNLNLTGLLTNIQNKGAQLAIIEEIVIFESVSLISLL